MAEFVDYIKMPRTQKSDRRPATTSELPQGNQGRVRSDNVAALEEEGLRFRSRPEICVYHALKRLNVTFAPLPVFVGGADHRRIEPDFVIYRDQRLIVIEVDGPTHTETAAEADKRTAMFRHVGAIVEHIPASDVDTVEKAYRRIKRLLANIFQQI